MKNLHLTTKEGESFALELPAEVQVVTTVFRETVTLAMSYQKTLQLGETILSFFNQLSEIRISEFGESRMVVDINLEKYDIVKIV